jgi:hypothetical protein
MRKSAHFPVGGGLNLTAPALKLRPGEILASQNYETDREGNYRRVDGYERYDGNPSPSDGSYWILSFDAGTDAPDLEDKVLGETSSATGIVIAINLTSGTWAGNDAVGTLVLYGVTGIFEDNETLSNLGPHKTAAGFASGFSNGFN